MERPIEVKFVSHEVREDIHIFTIDLKDPCCLYPIMFSIVCRSKDGMLDDECYDKLSRGISVRFHPDSKPSSSRTDDNKVRVKDGVRIEIDTTKVTDPNFSGLRLQSWFEKNCEVKM